MGRVVAVIALLLLLVPLAYAEDRPVLEFTVPGALTADEPLCTLSVPWVGSRNGDLPLFFDDRGDAAGRDVHIHTSPSNCADLRSEIFINYEYDFTARTAAESSLVGERAYLSEIGWTRFMQDERGTFGNNDGSRRRPLVRSQTAPLLSRPATSYAFQSGSFCADELDITFDTYTLAATMNGFSTAESGDEGEDGYNSCRGIWWENPSFNYGYNVDNRHVSDDDIRNVYDQRFQGWQAAPSIAAYQFPLYCDSIELSVIDEVNFIEGLQNTYTFRGTEGEGSGIHDSRQDGENWFTFEFTYSESTKTLEDFSIQMQDHGGDAGGLKYSLKCIDPPTPDTAQGPCEDPGIGNGEWDAPGQSYEDGGRCCYQPTLGESMTVEGVDHACIYNTGEERYEWSPEQAVACEPAPPEGERLSSDPTSYCCSLDNPQWDKKPHLFNVNGQWPDEAKGWFCESGDLERDDSRYEWAYDGEVWKECTEDFDGFGHGSHLCDFTDGTGIWTDCEERMVNGVCCENDMYDVESYETDLSTTVHKACFDGTYFVELAVATPVTVGRAQ